MGFAASQGHDVAVRGIEVALKRGDELVRQPCVLDRGVGAPQALQRLCPENLSTDATLAPRRRPGHGHADHEGARPHP
ncbi:hypothetical protein, partial [Streptomyces sp. SBT349]|uniref:hypothetical protein n=1 Tax=Streptomyces sp. SBT349 TaxID=1580539 RepID=UPI001F412C1A